MLFGVEDKSTELVPLVRPLIWQLDLLMPPAHHRTTRLVFDPFPEAGDIDDRDIPPPPALIHVRSSEIADRHGDRMDIDPIDHMEIDPPERHFRQR